MARVLDGFDDDVPRVCNPPPLNRYLEKFESDTGTSRHPHPLLDVHARAWARLDHIWKSLAFLVADRATGVQQASTITERLPMVAGTRVSF